MNFDKELILSASKKSWKMSSTHGTEFDKDFQKKAIRVRDLDFNNEDYTNNYKYFSIIPDTYHHILL